MTDIKSESFRMAVFHCILLMCICVNSCLGLTLYGRSRFAQIYADGSFIMSIHGTDTTVNFTLPNNTRLLAVYADDKINLHGFLLKLSNGFITGSHWKCTYSPSTGWVTLAFDDQAWTPAVVYSWPWGEHDLHPAEFISGEYFGTRDHVLCRGWVNCGCDHECIPGDDESFVCACNSGYFLLDDGTTCGEDPCVTSGCSHTCTRITLDLYQCECPEGFTLKDNHTCVNVDECDDDTNSCHQENTDSTAAIVGGVLGGFTIMVIIGISIALIFQIRLRRNVNTPTIADTNLQTPGDEGEVVTTPEQSNPVYDEAVSSHVPSARTTRDVSSGYEDVEQRAGATEGASSGYEIIREVYETAIHHQGMSQEEIPQYLTLVE